MRDVVDAAGYLGGFCLDMIDCSFFTSAMSFSRAEASVFLHRAPGHSKETGTS